MKMNIRSFSVVQTAKISAILYFIIALICVPFFMIAVAMNPRASTGGIGFVALMPFVYGVVGFLMTAVACLLYNVLAKYVGGVEFTVDERSEHVGPP
jgi:hypothetical protein